MLQGSHPATQRQQQRPDTAGRVTDAGSGLKMTQRFPSDISCKEELAVSCAKEESSAVQDVRRWCKTVLDIVNYKANIYSISYSIESMSSKFTKLSN